jgi:hypothetical protein
VFGLVRIWCVPVSELDRQHLLGEHAELHCIVGALLGKYKAYRNHPETLRFEGHIEKLYSRHTDQVAELAKRGYQHNSPLPEGKEPYICSAQELERDREDLTKRRLKNVKSM